MLSLSRETIERCQKTEYALVSSLQRDPMLADRIKRLRTVPGVGPTTALTWALEKLARYARLDPNILRPILHRTVAQQEASAPATWWCVCAQRR